MKQYQITMPIAGAVSADIQAESLEDAIIIFDANWTKALRAPDDVVDYVPDGNTYELVELEAYPEITTGNILNTSYTQMDVVESEIEEEEI